MRDFESGCPDLLQGLGQLGGTFAAQCIFSRQVPQFHPQQGGLQFIQA